MRKTLKCFDVKRKVCTFVPLEPAKPLSDAQIGGSFFIITMKPNYNKHYSSPKQIIDILQDERGLIFRDEAKAERYLSNISYHRLSAYIYPFYQTPKSERKIKAGTTFADVMRLYRFDKKLRVLLFNEIEKIEVAIRGVLANTGCSELGDDFWITNHQHFANGDKFRHTLQLINKELDASREDFIESFRNTYENPYPPAWMITEALSFGNLNYIYSNISSNRLRKDIAGYFGMQPKVFTSWLTVLVNIRNSVCHHARIWNRDFVIRATEPHNLSHKWIDSSRTDKARLYYRVCIVKYFLDVVSPQNDLRGKLADLFNMFPQIDLAAMGFPADWQTETLWC